MMSAATSAVTRSRRTCISRDIMIMMSAATSAVTGRSHDISQDKQIEPGLTKPSKIKIHPELIMTKNLVSG